MTRITNIRGRKGFYNHPEESKLKAVEWAERKAKKDKTEWGMVRFALTSDEINKISGQRLHFPTKFKRGRRTLQNCLAARRRCGSSSSNSIATFEPHPSCARKTMIGPPTT